MEAWWIVLAIPWEHLDMGAPFYFHIFEVLFSLVKLRIEAIIHNPKKPRRMDRREEQQVNVENCIKNALKHLSRSVLPENLRRGPYGVVERAEQAKPLFLNICWVVAPLLPSFLDPSIKDLLQRHFYLLFWTLVWRITTAPLLPSFLDSSIKDLLQRHFYLLFWTLVWRITIAPLLPSFLDPSVYVVTRGLISTKVESGFARFARSTTLNKKVIFFTTTLV